MTEDKLKKIIEDSVSAAVEPAIKKYVNGRIDGLTNELKVHTKNLNEHIVSHQADMEELKPIIQGISGAKVLGNLLIWLGGLAVAWVALKSLVLRQ